MKDGTHLSFHDRLHYAVTLVPQDKWQDLVGRSEKQIKRYLKGADVPFSVMQMVSYASGVPVDWIAGGKPSFGPSDFDLWRLSLKAPLRYSVPTSPDPDHPDDYDKFVEKHQLNDGNGHPEPPEQDFHPDDSSLEQPATGQDEMSGSQNSSLASSSGTSREHLNDPDEDRMPMSLAVVPQNYVQIPRYNIEASAGGGRLVDNPQIVEYVAFSEDFLRNTLRRRAQDLLLVLATGDSMEPTLRDREVLVVDLAPRDRIASGAIHVIALGDNLVVKRLELRLNGTVIVHSDNHRYREEVIAPDEVERMRIVGQVIWQLGPVRS